MGRSSSSNGNNHILAALPLDLRRAVMKQARPVRMEFKDEIHKKNRPIREIYFPITGVYSVVSDTRDGQTAEVAKVGNEGMLGLAVFFRTDTMALRVFAQFPGECLVMSATSFRQFIKDTTSPLCQVLYRYTQALFKIAQNAACMTVHPLSVRCTRWLLMTHDRVGTDRFPLTQEFLCQMLGVRRASVSAAVKRLQKDGLIEYRYGEITVLDRRALEKATCEHYQIIRDEYVRLRDFAKR